MKRLQIILFLSLIYLINSYCPQYFSAVLKSQCESLVINTTHSCTYLNGICTIKKSLCESYTGTSSDDCRAIKPKNILNKCAMVGGECKEVPKVCEDYISGIDTCSILQTDDNTKKRCVLSGGKCLPHYKSCADFVTGVNEVLCNSNIPEDNTNTKKCRWDRDNNECTEATKQCKDYEFMAQDNCPLLGTSDSNKVCFSSSFGFGCVEQYKTCELYDEIVQDIDKSKTKCESIRYFSDTINNFDYSKACYFSDNHCKTKIRECSDNISPDECTLYSGNVLPYINTDKICVFSEYQCKEQYKTCELYNEKVDASNRNEKACKAIIYYDIEKNAFDYSYKCIFENNVCKKKKKDCNEITEQNLCINHVLDDDENKMCVFENGKCKEEYKSCSDYNKVANKNEKNCKAIKIYSADKTNIDYTKKCIYESNVCQEKELTQCSDYDSDLDKKYCTNINLGTYKKCVIKDNKCTRKYIACPGNNEVNTKDECESILPLDQSKKCILDRSNNCIQEKKECSQYTGTDSYDCQQCTSSEVDKKCFIENGKCVAKFTECEKYKGNDAEICKKIIPYDSSGNYLGNINKCIMDRTNCKMTLKECDEANNYQECALLSAEKIKASSNIKNCVFKGGKCKEQYKDCDTYKNNNSGQIDKGICESIVIPEGRCLYTVSGESANCAKVNKQCSDFQAEDYGAVCVPEPNIPGVTLPINIKCLYTNSQCIDYNKSCLELSSISLPAGTSDDDAYKICAVASTSYPTRKQCVLKNDKSGCEEIDKIITDENENDNKNNVQKNKGNFCLNEKQFIINFIFIILGLLL